MFFTSVFRGRSRLSMPFVFSTPLSAKKRKDRKKMFLRPTLPLKAGALQILRHCLMSTFSLLLEESFPAILGSSGLLFLLSCAADEAQF